MNAQLGPDRQVFAAQAVHVTRDYGDFEIFVTAPQAVGAEHIALVRGEVRGQRDVLCRVQSACLTSTALNSAECDCVDQLHTALSMITLAPRGILIYLAQEGRGHGLTTKVRALQRKNEGMDTLAAVEALGLPADVREYGAVATILRALGDPSVQLMSNNPAKVAAVKQAGVRIDSVVTFDTSITMQARRHIAAKRARGQYAVE